MEEVNPNKSVGGEGATIEGLDAADVDARGKGEGELGDGLVDFPLLCKVCPLIRP
jgi:hypothetical protein